VAARAGDPGFGVFTEQLDAVDESVGQKVKHAAQGLAGAVTEPFVALARHPSATVRTLAVRFLCHRSEEAAERAVVAALGDREREVQEAALAGLSTLQPEATPRVVQLLQRESDWSMRARAAEALGKLAAGTEGGEAWRALAEAAHSDPFALVREAATRALARIDRGAAKPVLREVSEKDPEPQVRQTARALLR
jgi:HEAT repeat protein